MKIRPLIVIISLLYIHSAVAQDTDSLILDEVKSIKKHLWVLQQQLKENQKREYNNVKDIKHLSDSAIKKMTFFEQKIEKTNKNIQNNALHIKQIPKKLNAINKMTSNHYLINYVLHGIGLVLILILIWFLVREKRNNIDYLIKKSKALSVQNDEILEQANELSTIKKTLKKMLKQQKKIKKKKK